MKKQRKRKVNLWSSPTVTHSHYGGPRIIVSVHGDMGSTMIEATGTLSPS